MNINHLYKEKKYKFQEMNDRRISREWQDSPLFLPGKAVLAYLPANMQGITESNKSLRAEVQSKYCCYEQVPELGESLDCT